MSQRLYNFSAGPATMPLPVLERAAAAFVEYRDSGVGIAEVSHRGKEFTAVREEAEARCRSLMGVPDDYAVLFLQGGATQQFELLAMNLLKTRADYLDTGQWAAKAIEGATRYGAVRVLASSKASNYCELPDFTVDAGADYLHLCSNNTIFGTRFATFPEHPCLIADMSSEIMGRVIDVSRFGMIYAGAQKNLGPAGVVMVIIRKDLLEQVPSDIAPIFSYAKHAAADSCLNTPPTFGIAVLLETFRWLEEQGGIAAMEARNTAKAELLYQAIDGSDGYYRGTVTDTANRSHMNVTFVLPNEDLTKVFISGAAERGMVALKGYRSVGGIRASIYNAMPSEGVAALVGYMAQFKMANAAS
ncbi:MAG: 3-phosphoserine/phosphohydroxythreonine transaminase [Planctomycetota bacterium]|jgi:phosphoserine aminotransferase|nr:3-phosphoserine/phosphohydroxythreonine transaminase [Planctomycetota bacterium]